MDWVLVKNNYQTLITNTMNEPITIIPSWGNDKWSDTMNEPQIPTPRTNEAQFGTGRVSVDFARTLERELAAVTKERDEIPNCIAALESQAREYRKVMLEIETKNETLKQQRDTLAEALREMQYGHTDKAERMANEALATIESQ